MRNREGFPRVMRIVLGALLTGALLGSGPLLSWVRAHPACPVMAALAGPAQRWDDLMRATGMARPYDGVRHFARDLETAGSH